MKENFDRFWISFKTWFSNELPATNLLKNCYKHYDNWNQGTWYVDIDFSYEYKLHLGIDYPHTLEKDIVEYKEFIILIELIYNNYVDKRYEFTISFNERLRLFNIPMKLQNGKVIKEFLNISKITELTKREIIDIFSTGIIKDEKNLYMYYCGKLDEIELLSRIFDLKSLPSSSELIYNNAFDEFVKHTRANDDFNFKDIIEYPSLKIKDNDDNFLRLICEIFHPAVRDEKKEWREFLNIVNMLLQQDGYELYEKSHISGRAIYGSREIGVSEKILQKHIGDIKTNFDTNYVDLQVTLMYDLIKTAPHSAIGKAKELIEICCKTILEEQSIAYPIDLDLTQLMRMTCDSIDLSPKKIPNSVAEKDIAGRILGNLANISHGMAELRNLYGDGHGKSKNFKPLPSRYANLAVGAAVTAVNFMWETYQERLKKKSNGVT